MASEDKELWAQGAAAAELAPMVDYQEGSVVSRTLVKHPGGTVTLFAFAEGEEISEHTVPFDAMVHVLDGQANLRIGGNDVVVRAGEMTLMPANVPHAVKAQQGFKMLLAMIRV